MSEQQTNDSNDLIYLGGLWKSEPKNGGDPYLSGGLGIGGKVLIFKNKFKEADGESAPDWKLYLAPKPRKDGDSKAAKADDLI